MIIGDLTIAERASKAKRNSTAWSPLALLAAERAALLKQDYDNLVEPQLAWGRRQRGISGRFKAQRAFIHKHLPTLGRCYNQCLKRGPQASPRILLSYPNPHRQSCDLQPHELTEFSYRLR